ncbi:MAG: class I SAM-dependent methyltransferase [Thermodesulfobacteriota bacterium]|nr:class I SAM-dependent methyltransferase [Thermodesulfobacteriota bacterium]
MQTSNHKFNEIARTVFKPAYPVIADQIIKRTGITQGACLDIGCGGGYLGFALMAKTRISVYFLDSSQEMLEIAKGNIHEQGLIQRAAIIKGEATEIPLPANTCRLAVSRGSAFFWQNLPRAFLEIYRILRHGGMSYIGGGFGSAELKEKISREMEAIHGRKAWRNMVARNLGTGMRREFENSLKSASIKNYTIVHNHEEGLWVIMTREADCE